MKIEMDVDFLGEMLKALSPYQNKDGDENAVRAFYAYQLCLVVGVNNKVPGYRIIPMEG